MSENDNFETSVDDQDSGGLEFAVEDGDTAVSLTPNFRKFLKIIVFVILGTISVGIHRLAAGKQSRRTRAQ